MKTAAMLEHTCLNSSPRLGFSESRRFRLERQMKAWIAPLAVFLVTGCAVEQMRIEELTAKGAKPLTASEVRAVIVGSEVSGDGKLGGTLYEVAGADGSLGGTGVGTQGSFTYFGTWSINNNGDYCFSRESRDWPWSMKGCERWFGLGSDYFAVRDGVLYKRGVKRL